MAIRMPRIIQARKILKRSLSNGSTTPASMDIPKGYFAIYVGEQEKKRFVVSVSLLSEPTFQELLHQAEEEFGYNHCWCTHLSSSSYIESWGRDDFLLTLLRVFEAITEEGSVIEENHTTFVIEILLSLSVLCKGSKDGDARFLCLKIWFEVVVNMLNEAPKDARRLEVLKSVCRDHFIPMLPMLMEDEDPTPIYAQKLHDMLLEFNVIV